VHIEMVDIARYGVHAAVNFIVSHITRRFCRWPRRHQG
jgi:hypothetical protein